LSEHQPPPKQGLTPLAVVSLIAVVVFVLLFAAVAVALIGRIV
jgi:hypothetical protein